MKIISVSAERLSSHSFDVEGDSPERRAVRIIQGMNLNIVRDQGGVLAKIKSWKVDVVATRWVEQNNDQLEILLNGVSIYMDPKLVEATNARLREENFYTERDLCVIS